MTHEVSDADIGYATAQELRTLQVERARAPSEAIAAIPRRIEATNPAFNAFSSMMTEEATAAARARAKNGGRSSVFPGLAADSPYFVKIAAKQWVSRIEPSQKFLRRFGGGRKARAVFLGWRDERAKASALRADYAFTVLARILAWALDRRLILVNPCERAGRIWHGSRAEFPWSDDQEEAFPKVAPERIRLAFMLGLWTGQRQGDLLRLPWSAYDGELIHMAQSKTAARVPIPVGAPLKALLDATPRRSPIILTTVSGRPWTSGGFSASWRKALAKAEISGVTFNDRSCPGRWCS